MNLYFQSNTKALSAKKDLKDAVDQTFDSLKRLFAKPAIERLAKETRFIQRSSSKIKGFDFLVTLLISCTDASHSTLEQISSILSHVSRKAAISAQAIMKRVNSKNTVEFLQSVFCKSIGAKFLKLEQIPQSLLSNFSKVLIQDSSTITLHEKLKDSFKGSGGRASSAFAKLDVIYEYKEKKYEAIKLTDQREADQRLGLEIDNSVIRNALVIRDLGYLRIDGLKRIVDKGGYFLSRLRSDFMVFLNEKDEKPINLPTYLAKHCENGVFDREVFITTNKMRVRLVAHKAPQEVVDKRRREARATAKKQGRTLRKNTLNFFNFTVFITNVPFEIWNPTVVIKVYRVRWQIELIFKCWKSRAEIEYLVGTNPERIKCLIYAKLILILLIHQIYRLVEYIGTRHLGSMISMPKVFDWMKDPGRLTKIITGTLAHYEKRLFTENISRTFCMQKRNRKTTFEQLCESEFMNLNIALG